MHETRVLPVEDIYVGERLRKAAPDRVRALADSIRDIGLMTPISIRIVEGPIKIDGEDTWDVPVLVAGLHRLEAVKLLGWTKIECFELSADDIDAQLWEIAENLHRADLSALERDEHVAKWIALAEQKQAEGVVSTQVVSKPQGGRPEEGVRAAARELGLNREDARRAVKVASLTPEAKAAAIETGLEDKRSVLLEAAKQQADEQAAFLRREHARREAERERKELEKEKRDANRVIAITEAEQFAEWLLRHAAPGEIPTVISWLEGTRPREVIAALKRGAA